jgi:hypothetical protein
LRLLAQYPATLSDSHLARPADFARQIWPKSVFQTECLLFDSFLSLQSVPGLPRDICFTHHNSRCLFSAVFLSVPDLYFLFYILYRLRRLAEITGSWERVVRAPSTSFDYYLTRCCCSKSVKQ